MLQNFRFDRVEVRPSERALLIDGKPVELGSRAFDVLQALITHRDRVVTKDELLDMVWPGLVVEENNLQAQVSALRKLLGPKAIATIPGRGYQFVATEQKLEAQSIIAAESAAPPALPDAATPANNVTDGTRPEARGRSTLPARMQQHKGRVAVIAVTAALLAGVAGYWTVRQPVKVEVKPPPSSTTVSNVPAMSLVILPFTNLTGDPNLAFIADGLTAKITAGFSRAPGGGGFIVDAATASGYKDKTATAQKIGRDLGVRFVLQGNVQRSGTTIRIETQLADATTNAQLWSDSFDGDMSDRFALYERVITRIGNSIGSEMMTAAARDSEKRKGNPQVADLLTRAYALILQPMSLTNYQQMEALAREALALEPNNVAAMARLATSLAGQAGNYPDAFEDNITEKKLVEARDLALKVKELDPEISSVYLVFFAYAMAHDDFGGGRRAYETYLSLYPKGSSAYQLMAVSYFYGGEPRRAIEFLTQAGNLNPNPKGQGVDRMMNLCRAHYMLGDYDSAIQWCLKALDTDPKNHYSHAYLAMAYSAKGEDEKARAAVAELRKLPLGRQLSQKFERPQPSYPAAYKEWYEKKFLPVARKVGVIP